MKFQLDSRSFVSFARLSESRLFTLLSLASLVVLYVVSGTTFNQLRKKKKTTTNIFSFSSSSSSYGFLFFFFLCLMHDGISRDNNWLD